jgi:glutamyl-tRNA synthetase
VDILDLETIVIKFVYENALQHGKAKTGSVMGAIIAAHPELKIQAKEISSLVASHVKVVNDLDPETIKQTCIERYPEFFETKVKEKKKRELPPLEGAIDGKVCTRLPPEPSGYLHIGHGYSGFINYYYAKKYHGRLILRFEDTNPRKVEPKYYDSIREDFLYMGIEWDEEINESDRIPMYYEYAEELIKKGNAYVCNCPVNLVRDNRHNKKECKHRTQSKSENLEGWESMLNDSREGELTLRLKADISHENAALRDPSIMRVIEASHCLQGDKYRVWPLYDFAVAIEDSVAGITHVLRSEEFVQKVPLQRFIQNTLNLMSPRFVHFSRLRLVDVPVQKRQIRELIKKGVINSWDDFRLSTLSGLRRRGIVPETIRQLAIEMQLSTGQSELDMSILLAMNRKNVDDIAKRCFAVLNPIKLNIPNISGKEVSLDFHPKNKELGNRIIPYSETFYVSHSDLNILIPGNTIRLKDLLNIDIKDVQVLNNNQYNIIAKYNESLSFNFPKIQWVPHNFCVELLVNIPGPLFQNGQINPDSLLMKKGLIEKSVEQFQEGDQVQLERIGLGIIEKITENKIEVNMTE